MIVNGAENMEVTCSSGTKTVALACSDNMHVCTYLAS